MRPVGSRKPGGWWTQAPTLRTWGHGTVEEIKGKTTDEIFGPGATDHYMPVVQRIMAEGVPHSFEDYFLNLDKYFRFTSVPLGDYFITTGADITSIKKAEQALRNSEALLRTVLDNCPDPIFLKDLDCRLLLANRATFAVVGKPAEAVIGKTDAEFYDDPATGRAIMENDRRIMKSGQVEVVEESISDPAGTRVYLSAKAPYRDAEGRVIGLVGVTKEITERKQAENALKKSEERFRIAERLAKMGHFEWDVVDNVIVASSSLERIYALEPGGFKGGYEDWLKMVYSEDRVKVRDIIYLAFAEKRCEERFEFRIVHPDGDVRWISTEATATYDRSGSPLAVIGAMHTDITDRKQAEETLRKAYDELEKRVLERTLSCQKPLKSYELKTSNANNWKIPFESLKTRFDSSLHNADSPGDGKKEGCRRASRQHRRFSWRCQIQNRENCRRDDQGHGSPNPFEISGQGSRRSIEKSGGSWPICALPSWMTWGSLQP